MRGYKIEADFNESPLKTKIREEMVNKLAEEWNKIHNRMERLSWRERDEIDDEADFHSEIAEEAAANAVSFALKENPSLSAEEQKQIEEKEKADYYAEVERKANEPYLRLEVIEELLSDLGARMMRPYEHWNEDERYMEYMENRYDSYGDY
jgi:myo-inositol-1-phosphate synthase